jgi:hypothetical protein
VTSPTSKYPSFNTSLGRLMPSGQDLQQLVADMTTGGGGITDAPNNGNYYVRQNLGWVIMPSSTNVTSVAGKTGIVTLNHNDITDWAAATATFLTGNQSITLSGDVTGTGSTAVSATLATVNGNVGTFQGLTVNGKGLVTAASNMNYAPLNSPVFTGTPTAPTPTPGDNSNNVATTAFVTAAGGGGGGAATSVGATPPGSPTVGQLWWDSVGGQLYIYYNDGNSSQWVAASSLTLGSSVPPLVAPPVAASWTQRSFGGSTTLTDVANGVAIYDKSAVSTHTVRAITIVSPATPYTIDVEIAADVFIIPGGGSCYIGLGWTDGTKFQAVSLEPAYNSPTVFTTHQWSNSTTDAADTAGSNWWCPNIAMQSIRLRIADNGTNITTYNSTDGINWLSNYTVAKASGYLGSSGYSNVGIIFDSGPLGNGGSGIVTLKSWWVH